MKLPKTSQPYEERLFSYYRQHGLTYSNMIYVPKE